MARYSPNIFLQPFSAALVAGVVGALAVRYDLSSTLRLVAVCPCMVLDTWTLLLSGSGVGRNTLISLLWPVLKEAGLEDLPRNTTWGSKQGFYQDLAEDANGFFIWEEVSAALKALSDSKFGEAKQWFTNCYDNLRPPAAIKYRKSNLGSDTPGIVFVAPPRVSILATSSHDWFINNLSQEDSTGGFIPRWFLIDLPTLDRAIPIPKKPDERAIPNLADCLRGVSKLKGAVDLSKVEDLYCDWYKPTRERFSEQANDPQNRKLYVYKLLPP